MGIRMVKVVVPPGVLSAEMVIPWRIAIWPAMARPKPVPFGLLPVLAL